MLLIIEILGQVSSAGAPSFGGVPHQQQPVGGYQQRFPPPPQSSTAPPPPSGSNVTLTAIIYKCYTLCELLTCLAMVLADGLLLGTQVQTHSALPTGGKRVYPVS